MCLLGQVTGEAVLTGSARVAESSGPTGSGEAAQPVHRSLHYFGDYELLKEIARGGMGVVYKARQASLNRIVAVKLLPFAGLATPQQVKRFRAEAEAAANLQHPNIVAIYEVGEHEGQQYFSMEYVEGRDLSAIARDTPLPAARAARYTKAIAEAIGYAHQHGVIHRDLKPSNVLIGSDDQPRVTDFGLAKRLVAQASPPASSSGVAAARADLDSGRGRPENPQARTPAPHDLTLTGQILGTPGFMPPEQATAGRGQVGPASDVYSIGAILYYLVTARPPFAGETFESTLAQLLNDDPPAPRLLNPAVPRDLETICLKCLEKEPSRRYRTAEDLAQDLEAWQEGRPIRARPIGLGERAAKWVRRRPAIAALLAALIFTALLGAGGILWKEQQTARALKESQRMARLLRDASAALGPTVSPNERLRLLDGVAERLESDLAGRTELQADVRDALGSVYSSIPDLRKSEAMFREALALRRKLHGDVHPEVASLLNSLAVVLQMQGRRAEAEPFARESVEIFEKLRGADDPSLDVPRDNLAFFLRRLGKLSESEKHYRTALEVAQKRHGPDSREAAIAVPPLVQVMMEQNKFAEGEPLASNAVRILQKELTNDWRTFDAISVWGGTLSGQGNFDQAKPLLHSGYEGLERLVDINARLARTRRQEALWRLKLYYETNGPPDQAAEWRRQYEDWGRKVSEANTARAGRTPASEGNRPPVQATE